MNRRDFLSGTSAGLVAAYLLQASGNARAATGPNDAPLTLWYDSPATQWNEALPLGNGRIGAMVYGSLEREKIQFNEATLWTGNPHSYVNPDAYDHLATIRDMIYQERSTDAHGYASNLMGKPAIIQAFQPFCDLNLDFFSDPHPGRYTRSLDLKTATARISNIVGATDFAAGNEFRREAFVSYPDQVFVLNLTGSRGLQTLKISLSSPHPDVDISVVGSDLMLAGQLRPQSPPDGSWIGNWEGKGLRFAARLRLNVKGGRVTQEGNTLFVSDADDITILMCLATSFINYTDISADPVERVTRDLEAASQRGLAELRQRHIDDYQNLFQRVAIDLASAPETTSIEKAIGPHKSASPYLYGLFYQLGRYILISSSRPGGQAANLQGIWNQSLWPWWGSKWTTNVNLQMNYWISETGNLRECFEPFTKLLDDLMVTGKEVARVHYRASGFVFHHNADIWRAATPVDGFWGLWPVGGAWLALQAHDHYAFTADQEYLRDHAYPALKGSVEFLLDYLTPIPSDKRFAGALVTNPTCSPENWFTHEDGSRGFLTYGATMDIQILNELFERFASSARRLGVDAGLRKRALAAKKKLPPLQIGKTGALQEWIKDYDEVEIGHRHISHLYSVFPGSDITPQATPELATAAKRTLERRGRDAGGGSCFKAFRALLWARLGDGNQALAMLSDILAYATTPNLLTDSYDQVDGHLGGPAAIAEMLVQSHTGDIVFLPALPESWPAGSVKGLCVRGGATVNFSWSDGKLNSASLLATSSNLFSLRHKGARVQIQCEAGQEIFFDGNLKILRRLKVEKKAAELP